MRARHRLYLADNLWIIGHDEYTGKARISDHAIGLGLAGSLLGELILHGNVALSTRRELVVLKHESPPDEVGHTLLSQIIAETQRPRDVQVTQVRDWLSYLSEFAAAWTVQRLTSSGVLRTVHIRGLLGRSKATHPALNDVNDAAVLSANISTRLADRSPLRTADVAFAAFTLVTGLERRVLVDLNENHRSYLRRLLAGLPGSLRSLIAETEAAIGDAVLSHRI